MSEYIVGDQIKFITKIDKPDNVKIGKIIRVVNGYDKHVYYTVLVNSEIKDTKYLCYIITLDHIIDIIRVKHVDQDIFDQLSKLEELYKSWLKNI